MSIGIRDTRKLDAVYNMTELDVRKQVNLKILSVYRIYRRVWSINFTYYWTIYGITQCNAAKKYKWSFS